MNLFFSKRAVLLFIAVVNLIFAFIYFAIPKERLLKRDMEIERIFEKEYRFDSCIQYALIARINGWFPCTHCSGSQIYLLSGEVWKYGKTCLSDVKRYPGGLPDARLRFVPLFLGTEKECLIEEKQKIYNYPLLPECAKREKKLVRPPGNKIDR